MLDVPLQPPAKVLEHSRTSRENDVLRDSGQMMNSHTARRTHLVQASSDINRTRLNHVIHDLGQGRQKVRAVNFGIEKDFGGEEPLVTNVNVVFPACNAVFAGESRKVLVGIGVVLADFLDNVLADIGVVFLDLFGAGGIAVLAQGPV